MDIAPTLFEYGAQPNAESRVTTPSFITFIHDSAKKRAIGHCKFNKLAPYGTGGRLLLTANFKVT